MILKNYIKEQYKFIALFIFALTAFSTQEAFAQPYCDEAQGVPGFGSDPVCEASICAADPFCCNISWDGICAGAAETNPACVGCLEPVVPPANDNACDATPLLIGDAAVIDNEHATAEPYEQNPGPGSTGCSSVDGWCSFELEVTNSVWYTFVAPASGCVSIDVLGTTDLQMAVWLAEDCSAMLKFKEVAADDDSGDAFSPELQNISVTPGLTYYIQIDGYNGQFTNDDKIVVTDGAGPVPAPWTTAHNGNAVGNFGYVTCGDQYTLSTNQYAHPFKDQGGYILQTLCGDGYVEARLDDIQTPGWAGIVMRESLAQGSKKVAMKSQLGNFIRRDVRKNTNSFAQSQQYPRPIGWNWLRLERVGNQFIGWVSENGEDWQQIMATAVPMNNCLQVGMFVESINVNTVTTAMMSSPSAGPCPCLFSFPGQYDGAYCGESTGTPGFPDDPACEAAVCAVDPFCCNISWDGICAGEAVNDFPTECADCLSVGPAPLAQAETTPEALNGLTVDRVGLNVYPNPSAGLVNIEATEFLGTDVSLVIYNSIGQEVYTERFAELSTSVISVDLRNEKVANGIYHVNFVSNGERIAKQIVISK